MEYFQWSDEIKIGVDEIDAQHKYLISTLNELGYAIENDASSYVVLAILYKVQEYTVYHFDAEKELMQKYKYPTALMCAHINEHDSFITEIDYVLTCFTEKKDTIAAEVYSFLSKWLLFHIMNTDKLLAAAIKASDK